MVLEAAPSSALSQAVSNPKEDGGEVGGTAPAGLLGSHSHDQFEPVSLGLSSDNVAAGATRMIAQSIHANHAGRPTGSYDKHKRHVILFKTPQSESKPSTDPYYELLNQYGYETTFVPVLEDAYDTAALERVLGGDVEDNRGERVNAGFDGIIITSRRGAEGWMSSARTVQAADQGK